MESVYHIVTIRVNETSWAHVWRLRSRYLGTGYDRGPQQVAALARELLATMAGWVDRDAPSADIFQPPDSTAPKEEDENVDVSRTMWPRPPILRGVERSGVGSPKSARSWIKESSRPPGASLIPLLSGIASVSFHGSIFSLRS
jgi:hypothetical protein